MSKRSKALWAHESAGWAPVGRLRDLFPTVSVAPGGALYAREGVMNLALRDASHLSNEIVHARKVGVTYTKIAAATRRPVTDADRVRYWRQFHEALVDANLDSHTCPGCKGVSTERLPFESAEKWANLS